MKSPHWFLVALLALVLPTLGKPPVADEESYLFMAQAIADHPLRPYDWWRVWQPWGEAPATETFSFAHPPLHLWWLALIQAIAPEGPAMRLLSALPFLLLFGWSAQRLAAQTSRHPNYALAFCLTSPVLLLGIQDTWMIDLGFVALSTASVALYREALLVRGEINSRKLMAAGVFLGLAASYKYPALMLVLLFAGHLKKLGLIRHSLTLWVSFLSVFGAIQAYLALQYGELHLVAALQSASEIDRSPLTERSAGMLVRFGFALSPLALLASTQLARTLPIGLALGGVSVLLIGQGDLSLAQQALLFLLASAGGSFVGRAITATWSHSSRLRQGDREDGLLLGGWVILVLISIVIGHNHADARYLLPALLPMSLLLTRSSARVAGGKRTLQLAGFAWAAVAVLTAMADYRLAQHTQALAEKMVQENPPGRFSAEWTARWTLERAGWQFWHPSETLTPGDRVLLFSNAGSASPPPDSELVETYSAASRFPIRTLDWQTDAGYHSEQLGRLPITWGNGPLTEALVYEVSE